MTDTLPVFIGFDTREVEAFNVCRYSMTRHSNIPLHVQSLNEKNLRWNKLYWRDFTTTKSGQKIDAVDGKPFSTEFSFTRFLVPALCQYEGWAVFVDCDFLFMADIGEMIESADETKALLALAYGAVPDEPLPPELTALLDQLTGGSECPKESRESSSSTSRRNCSTSDPSGFEINS